VKKPATLIMEHQRKPEDRIERVWQGMDLQRQDIERLNFMVELLTSRVGELQKELRSMKRVTGHESRVTNLESRNL
jgi:hypothetical protein